MTNDTDAFSSPLASLAPGDKKCTVRDQCTPSMKKKTSERVGMLTPAHEKARKFQEGLVNQNDSLLIDFDVAVQSLALPFSGARANAPPCLKQNLWKPRRVRWDVF